MGGWIRIVRDALLLRTPVFEEFRERDDSFLRGFLLLVAVALIAGFPAFILDTSRALRTQPQLPERADASAVVDEIMARIEPIVRNNPGAGASADVALAMIRDNIEMGMNIGTQIASLPTVLPAPAGAAMRAVGEWVSLPFGRGGFVPLTAAAIGTWLGYGLWVLLASKLMGGHATAREFFGTTALYSAPHLLNVFSPLGLIGFWVGVVASLWGLAVYVKATAVSNRFTTERAILAVLLPILLAVLVLGLLFSLLVGLIATSIPQ